MAQLATDKAKKKNKRGQTQLTPLSFSSSPKLTSASAFSQRPLLSQQPSFLGKSQSFRVNHGQRANPEAVSLDRFKKSRKILKRKGANKKALSSDSFFKRLNKLKPANAKINYQFLDYLWTYYTVIQPQEVDSNTIINEYWRTVEAGTKYFNDNAQELEQLKKELETETNKKTRTKLEERQKKVTEKKDDPNLDSKIIIFRGMTPLQARKVLTNKTLGGDSPSQQNRGAPPEKDAKAQTGLNIKETEQGRIEEWSEKWGGLTGFSTGGVMLMAMLPRDQIRTAKAKIGERGATGYANQRVEEIAIYNIGNPSLIPRETQLFQNMKYTFNQAKGIKDKTEVKNNLAFID